MMPCINNKSRSDGRSFNSRCVQITYVKWCCGAGASSVEIMLGHMVTQLIVMVGQVTLLLVFALAVFGVSAWLFVAEEHHQ